MIVARATEVPQKALHRVRVSYQSQGHPARKSVTPVTNQRANIAQALRQGSLARAQAAMTGSKSQAWILVRRASDQTAPAWMTARNERPASNARAPTKRASVQKRLRNVSRAA